MQYYSPGAFGTLPPAVKNLLIINILLFFASYVFASTFHINLIDTLGLHYFTSERFQIYQFVTHMFMHAGLAHIFFNMFALWMFGKVIESVWGSKRFLIYYFVTGLGAAALHSFVNWIQVSSMEHAITAYTNTPSPEAFSVLVKKYFPAYYTQVYNKLLDFWYADPDNSSYFYQSMSFIRDLVRYKIDIPTVGASGAVFGVLLAFGMMFPNAVLYIYFAIPMKAKYFVILYGALELYLGFANHPGDNVAHFAHLGGMLFGFFLIKYWNRNRFIDYY